MNTRFSAIYLLLLIPVLILLSCPAQITENILTHINDETPPVITILSPEDGSYCAKTVVVSGSVLDTSISESATGEVSSLSYQILSSDLSGEIAVSEDGSFTFDFITTTLGSNFVLELLAVDWNGNSTNESLNLYILEGDDIPSFSVTTGNKEVVLSWDEVPQTESYTIYYTTEGSPPTEYYGEVLENITSPYTLGNLKNGNLHYFLLKAVTSIPDGEDNWSDFVKTIPLSSLTLASRVESEIGQIRIVWPEIPATDQFEVWRGIEQEGDYVNISGIRIGNDYVDKQMLGASGFFYKIRPAADCPEFSISVFGSPAYFPETYSQVDFAAVTGDARRITINGNRAYIANSTEGLQIFDITDPENIVLLKTVDTPDTTLGIAVYGDYAYLAVSGTPDSVQIIDINENSANYGTIAHVINTSSNAFGVAVSEVYDRVCVTTYYQGSTCGLDIINITDPITNATINHTVVTSDDGNDVAISGIYAYVATDGGTDIIDITDFGTAVPALTVAPPAGQLSHEVHGITIDGDAAYVAYSQGISSADGGLQIIDISTPLSAADNGSVNTNGIARGVSVSGSFAYVADSSRGMKIINIDDPYTSKITSTPYLHLDVDTDGTAYDTAVTGNYIFCATGNGIQVVEFRNPSRGTLVDTIPTSNSANSITVIGDYAYLAEGDAGLRIMNVTNPQSVSTINTVLTDDSADYVEVRGDYAFVAAGSAGLQIIDISSPSSASVVKTIATGSSAKSIALFGDYCIVSLGSSGLNIIDISVVNDAAIVKTIDTPGYAYNAAVSGNFAYVADNNNGLQIIDITNIDTAKIVRNVEIRRPDDSGTVSAVGVTINGDYAFVSTATHLNDPPGGLQIADISDPLESSVIQIVDVSSTLVYHTSISGNYAYLSCWPYSFFPSLQIVDISNITNAKVIKSFNNMSGNAFGSAVNGKYVFLANGAEGLKIIDLMPE